MKQVFASVISNSEVMPGITRPRARTILNSRLIWLNCPEIAREARPGQFVMVCCGGDCVLPRPFSIHQVNKDGIALFFAVWEDGKGANWLSQRQQGDTVELFGPLGNGYSIESTSGNLLLVAGGIGIAPLYFLAQHVLSQGYSVTLLLGASTATQLYPGHLLPPKVALIIATEDGTAGQKGMITDLLPDCIGWADQVFACGPVPMYRNMANNYPQLKNRPLRVSLEVRMGCGRGVCYGCTLRTKSGLKRVCQDGPVFDLDDVLWDELSL